ncbi:MAG: DUF5925 domain-containing protein, partial [Actinomycetota bacterium]|nr:DUF5925 domain-containing protein [Actinomycetota bacterium]
MDHLPARFALDSLEHDLGPFHFVRSLFANDHDHVVRRELKRSIPLAALPGRARNVRTVDLGGSSHVVAEIDGAVVHIQSWKTSANVTASAADAAVALAVVEEIRSHVPDEIKEDRVDVVFTDGTGGSRYVELEARPWSAVCRNYPDEERHALDGLVN